MRNTRTSLWILLALLFYQGTAHATTLLPSLPAHVSQLNQQKTSPALNEAQAPATGQPASAQGWIPKCVSSSRRSPVECSVEETLVMANTGQPVSSVVVQMPANAREPVLTIRVPVGLYLPAGVTIQIDEQKPEPVPLLTCDLQGCFAQMTLNPNMIAALKGGKKLSVSFQNMAKANVVLPFPLGNFADAYQKIQ
jgi:invasion protein IalB